MLMALMTGLHIETGSIAIQHHSVCFMLIKMISLLFLSLSLIVCIW